MEKTHGHYRRVLNAVEQFAKDRPKVYKCLCKYWRTTKASGATIGAQTMLF